MNIQTEAAINSNKITDMGKTKDEYIDGRIHVESPFFSHILLYKDYLIVNSEYTLLEEKYKYRPQYLAYDKYGDMNLDYIILLLNNCRSYMDFNKSYVYIPDINILIDTLNKIKTKKTKLDMSSY